MHSILAGPVGLDQPRRLDRTGDCGWLASTASRQRPVRRSVVALMWLFREIRDFSDYPLHLRNCCARSAREIGPPAGEEVVREIALRRATCVARSCRRE